MARPMRNFARWHVWLGWLTGVPILLWIVSGLVMIAKPIEEVRGNHLKREVAQQALPPGNPAPISMEIGAPQVREVRTLVQNGRAVTLLAMMDGSTRRYDAITAEPLPRFTDVEARQLVAREIIGGERVVAVSEIAGENPPLDFRRPVDAWQVKLADGTYVYVGRDSGAIEAVRTRWWRFFDVMWGLHIMDLQTREDTHHPVLILFAALALTGSLLGTVLLFRRRLARVIP